MADSGISKPTGTECQVEAVLADLEKIAPQLGSLASRSASERLNAVQRILAYRTIESYDANDRAGFAAIMVELSDHVPDPSALAGLFGVSVSTLYRWKSGDSVPQKLVRAAVKEHLLRLLDPISGERRYAQPRRDFAN